MKKLFIVTIMFLLSGCAAMQQSYVEQKCNTDAAYAAGVNAAKNGRNMRANYAADCPTNQAEINASYRQGYQYAFSANNNNSGINININGNNSRSNGWMCTQGIGGEVCGYGCITSFGVTRCARFPGQQCLADNFGNIACGYHCMKSLNSVKCAQSWGDNCVKSNFGDVKCGINCRFDFGQIKCDQERYQR